MRKWLTIALSLIVLTAIAQDEYFVDVDISNQAPTVGEELRIEYILKFKGRSGSFNLSGIQIRKPKIKDVQIIDERAGMKMDMNFSNRGMNTMDLYQYIIILKPLKQGKLNIPPMEFIWRGQTFKSTELNLDIKKGEPNSANNSNTPKQIGQKDLYARTIVSKSSPYQGEQISVSYKIYSRVNLVNLGEVNLPELSGFWVEDIPNQEIKIDNETINGLPYRIVTLKRSIIAPQKSGKLVIPTMDIECIVQEVHERKASNPSERFWYGDRVKVQRNVPHKIKSPAYSLNVKPLPDAGKPVGFSGAVGKYSIKSSIDRQETKSNESITYTIQISGKGNLKLLDQPSINFPPDFDVYDPKIKNNIRTSAGGSSGSVSFEYLLIPRNAGFFQIPEVDFNFFDLESKSYKSVKSAAFEVHVEKGEQSEMIVSSSTNKEDIRFIGKDIRYIKSYPFALSLKNDFVLGSLKYWLWILIPALLFFMVIAYYRFLKPDQSSRAFISGRAGKVSRKRLRKAEKLMKLNQRSEFFEEVSQAVWGYLTDKLNISLADLSIEYVQKELEMHQTNPSIIKEIEEVLNQCEYSRFAPSSDENEMGTVYHAAAKVITEIENTLK